MRHLRVTCVALVKEARLRVRFSEVKEAYFLLMAGSEKVGSIRGDRYSANDVVVRERMKNTPGIGVPDFAVRRSRVVRYRASTSNARKENGETYAVKSALPVAAFDVSADSFVLQTAPL